MTTRASRHVFVSSGKNSVEVGAAAELNHAFTEMDDIRDLLMGVREMFQDTRSAELGSVRDAAGNACLTSPGLAIGTSSTAKVKIVNTTTYTLAGELKAKLTAEVAFTATTHDIADGSERVYLISLDTDGNATVTAGTAAVGAGNATIPACPAANTAIGHVRIFTTGAIFDATTTALSAVTLTVTYTNLGVQPLPAIAVGSTRFGTDLTALRAYMGYLCLSAPGLVIGSSSAAKVKIANTTVFLSAGVFKSKTTAEVPFTATTHDIAASTTIIKEAVYLLSLASDGTPTLTMGTIASGSGNATIPACPASGTPIGYVRVAVHAGSTSFDASTDLLTATHLTVAYTDLSAMPFVFTCESARLTDEMQKVLDQLGNRALDTAGLAIGSVSKKKVKIANTTPYLNARLFKSKATAEVAFTPGDHDIPANADSVQEAVYLVCLSSAGVASLTMGAISSGASTAVVPEAPAGLTPIGHVRIGIAAGAVSFDASSDDLDAAHITDTYVNISHVAFSAIGDMDLADPLAKTLQNTSIK